MKKLIIILCLFSMVSAACVNLSNSSTWGGNIVNESGVLNINLNTTLCGDTYYLDNKTSTPQVLQFNASGITLNCNGSIIDGLDNDGYGIYLATKEYNTIENCTVRHYNRAIYLYDNANYNRVSSNVVHESGCVCCPSCAWEGCEA